MSGNDKRLWEETEDVVEVVDYECRRSAETRRGRPERVCTHLSNNSGQMEHSGSRSREGARQHAVEDDEDQDVLAPSSLDFIHRRSTASLTPNSLASLSTRCFLNRVKTPMNSINLFPKGL
jgi:hypothetical protein